MEFIPILFLLFWLLIVPALKKATTVQRKGPGNPAQPGIPAARPEKTDESVPQEGPVRTTELRPSISFTEHDDSVYQGSMNAVTGEGYDPCHEEQLSSLSSAETAVPSEPAPVPGLQLSWTGSDVVRGIVMSEILKRK